MDGGRLRQREAADFVDAAVDILNVARGGGDASGNADALLALEPFGLKLQVALNLMNRDAGFLAEDGEAAGVGGFLASDNNH